MYRQEGLNATSKPEGTKSLSGHLVKQTVEIERKQFANLEAHFDKSHSKNATVNESVPIFTQHEVAVPYGCSPEEIEAALLKFVVDLVSPKEMLHVKKLFFVPVGLPGMGKSTLAKHIKLATGKHLRGPNNNSVENEGDSDSKTQLRSAHLENQINSCLETTLGGAVPNVSFTKISYDRILGENLSAYQEKHPEVPFHEIIDIIRSKAD